MPRPYMRPSRRNPPEEQHDNDNPALDGPAGPAPVPADSEPTSVFVSKEAIGYDVKPGDKVEMTVQSVDPESGEVEMQCEHGESKDHMTAFDEEMPNET